MAFLEKFVTLAGLRLRARMVVNQLDDDGGCIRHLEQAAERIEALEARIKFEGRIALDAHTAIREVMRMCQMSVADLATEHPDRAKLRLAVFSALELRTLNLGNIARRAEQEMSS